jgi:hypothetical protein
MEITYRQAAGFALKHLTETIQATEIAEYQVAQAFLRQVIDGQVEVTAVPPGPSTEDTQTSE